MLVVLGLLTFGEIALFSVLLGFLLLTTAVFALASRSAYLALETQARRLGRLDQTTMF